MYPTKEEILQALYLPTKQEIEAIELWKKSYYKQKWSQSTAEEKHDRLEFLLELLCSIHHKRKCLYEVAKENHWSHISTNPAIIKAPLNNPSIISLLHELGHHLFGPSELTACRYSVGIFKTCFSKAYEKLIWEGHTLKKQT
jgi:hypothetical protein